MRDKIEKLELEDLYINKELSAYQIAKIKGCNPCNIFRLLKFYNIPRRNASELNKLRWKDPLFRENMINRLKTRDVYWTDKISKATKGEKNPFFGKKHTKETLTLLEKKVYSKIRGKSYEERYGIKKTKEVKEKQIINRKSNIGKNFPKELYPNMGWRKSRKNQIFPVKDTLIEIKIQEFLKELKIEFLTHQYMKIDHGYQCDIFISPQVIIYENGEVFEIKQKTVIECDGDYWHGNSEKYPEEKLTEKQKKQREKDEFRTKELKEKGFRVIRIWENDIKILEINDFKKIMQLV